MDTWLIVLCFAVIAVMRVVQKLCVKRVSGAVAGNTFFHYGGYYNLVSALFAFVLLCVSGFSGFTWGTALCAAGTAVFLAISLFTSLEALKSCSLIVCQMFSVGALCIPCIVGIFLFDEPMSVWQWLGVLLFIISTYFIVRPATPKESMDKAGKLSLRNLLLLVIMLLAEGGTMVMQKAFGVFVPNGNVSTYSFLMFALNSLFLYATYAFLALPRRFCAAKDSAVAEPRRLSRLLLVCGAFLASAVFAINQLVTTMGKSVHSAVLFSVSSAISIIITLAVGAFYYKERVSFLNALGILLCVVAIAIINFL